MRVGGGQHVVALRVLVHQPHGELGEGGEEGRWWGWGVQEGGFRLIYLEKREQKPVQGSR